jgi:hypothetical protein
VNSNCRDKIISRWITFNGDLNIPSFLQWDQSMQKFTVYTTSNFDAGWYTVGIHATIINQDASMGIPQASSEFSLVIYKKTAVNPGNPYFAEDIS